MNVPTVIDEVRRELTVTSVDGITYPIQKQPIDAAER
jgi:hypothetical protein